jgi:hypothetical protein
VEARRAVWGSRQRRNSLLGPGDGGFGGSDGLHGRLVEFGVGRHASRLNSTVSMLRGKSSTPAKHRRHVVRGGAPPWRSHGSRGAESWA